VVIVALQVIDAGQRVPALLGLGTVLAGVPLARLVLPRGTPAI
jgi:hypothetical protein